MQEPRSSPCAHPSLTLAHPRSITPNRLLPPRAIPDTACASRFKFSCQWIWGTVPSARSQMKRISGLFFFFFFFLLSPYHLRPNRLKLFLARFRSFSRSFWLLPLPPPCISTWMARKKVTAEELLAQARSKGYRRGGSSGRGLQTRPVKAY